MRDLTEVIMYLGRNMNARTASEKFTEMTDRYYDKHRSSAINSHNDSTLWNLYVEREHDVLLRWAKKYVQHTSDSQNYFLKEMEND